MFDDDFVDNDPKEWLANNGYDRLAKDDKRLNKNFNKIKKLMIEDYMSNLDHETNGMKINDYIFDSISIAKLGEWVNEIFQLIKNEIDQDILMAKDLKEKEILAIKKHLDERMRKKHNIEKHAEKDFDMGPFK